jgi:ribosomal protein S20
MAVLTDEQRAQVHAGLMRYTSRLLQSVNLSKSELRTAVNDTDQWLEDNAASYNSALSAAAQANLGAAQKTLLLCVVAARRVSKAFAVSLLGVVD